MFFTQTILQSIVATTKIPIFEDAVKEWSKKLTTADGVITNWLGERLPWDFVFTSEYVKYPNFQKTDAIYRFLLR